MTEPGRSIAVFFYGLYMDQEVLSGQGVTASSARPAVLDGFELRIGARATLVPASPGRSYGVVMQLTHGVLDRLYGAPGLERYRPEAVLCATLDGEEIPALCYNLPEAPPAEERNLEYARKLRLVLEKLGFPGEYIATVKG